MKKIFKYTMMLAAMALVLVSCKDEDPWTKGTWNADPDYQDVSFDIASFAEELDPSDPTIANVKIYRNTTAGDAVVPIKILQNTDSVFTVDEVRFADGDSVANVKISFPNAAVGKAYTLELFIDDPKFASNYSTSTTYTYTVTRVKWDPAGYMVVTAEDLAWKAANDDAGTEFRPLYVEDENGNLVPISYYSVGDTIKGWVRYTDDLVASIYGLANTTYPVKCQERADKPGVYRLVNAYTWNFDSNWPGDWDDTQDYYMVFDASDPDQVYMSPATAKLGLVWSYGHFTVLNLAGDAIESGDESEAADYYGTLKNGAITFPKNSMYQAMENYKDGDWYFYGNSSGAFRIVLDPSKDLYIVNIEKDYDYANVFEGEFNSGQIGALGSVILQKGTLKADIAALDKTGQLADTLGTPYRLVDPYAEGYDLYFMVNREGVVVVPEGYELQEIGLNDNMGNNIYAKISGGASTFSENEVALNITFQNKKGTLVYGTASEVIANIVWDTIGTGTYTYAAWAEGEDPDPGYAFLKRADKDNVYGIGEWLYGVTFKFTWNKADNTCTVPEQYIGYTHNQYGPIYVGDLNAYGDYPYSDYPCTYDPETQTFTFTLIYYEGGGGYFAMGAETFQVEFDESGNAVKAHRIAGNTSLKLKKMLEGSRRAKRFVGKRIPFQHRAMMAPIAPQNLMLK